MRTYKIESRAFIVCVLLFHALLAADVYHLKDGGAIGVKQGVKKEKKAAGQALDDRCESFEVLVEDEGDSELPEDSIVMAVANEVPRPTDAELDRKGNLYILCGEKSEVWIFDKSLKLYAKRKVAASNAAAIAVDLDGAMYVADAGGQRIFKYNADGEQDNEFGNEGRIDLSGVEGCESMRLTGIAVAAWDNEVYVYDGGNQCVQVFDRAGEFLRTTQLSGYEHKGGCNSGGISLEWRALDSKMFVAEKENNYLRCFWVDSGGCIGHFGKKGRGRGEFEGPCDVCYNPRQETVTVADTGNNRIQVLSVGVNEVSFVREISGPGFSGPEAVVCDPDPNGFYEIIYVCDTGNDRVVKVRPVLDPPGCSPEDVFAAMKSALGNGNIELAVGYFDESTREMYREVFTEAGEADIEKMLTAMGKLRPSMENGGILVYDLEVDGSLYPVQFARDEKGVWKIVKF